MEAERRDHRNDDVICRADPCIALILSFRLVPRCAYELNSWSARDSEDTDSTLEDTISFDSTRCTSLRHQHRINNTFHNRRTGLGNLIVAASPPFDTVYAIQSRGASLRVSINSTERGASCQSIRSTALWFSLQATQLGVETVHAGRWRLQQSYRPPSHYASKCRQEPSQVLLRTSSRWELIYKLAHVLARFVNAYNRRYPPTQHRNDSESSLVDEHWPTMSKHWAMR